MFNFAEEINTTISKRLMFPLSSCKTFLLLFPWCICSVVRPLWRSMLPYGYSYKAFCSRPD